MYARVHLSRCILRVRHLPWILYRYRMVYVAIDMLVGRLIPDQVPRLFVCVLSWVRGGLPRMGHAHRAGWMSKWVVLGGPRRPGRTLSSRVVYLVCESPFSRGRMTGVVLDVAVDVVIGGHTAGFVGLVIRGWRRRWRLL